MRDVRERPCVDERRLALDRLHEVGLDRVLEQNGHRAGDLQILGGHRGSLDARRDGDRAQAVPEIVPVAGHREQRHHLGGGRDVEPALARERCVLADADRDPAQDAVLDVEAPAPGDRGRVDAELVSVDEMRVDRRREQVVGGGDRMQVTGEVEVDVLAGDDLGTAGSGASTLCAERRPDRRLSEANERALADLAEPSVRETAVVVLPSPAFVGVTAVTAISFPLGRVARRSRTHEVDLRLVAAEELDLVRIEVEARRELGDRTQFGSRPAGRPQLPWPWLSLCALRPVAPSVPTLSGARITRNALGAPSDASQGARPDHLVERRSHDISNNHARKRAGTSRLHRVAAAEAMHRGVLSVPFDTPLTKVAADDGALPDALRRGARGARRVSDPLLGPDPRSRTRSDRHHARSRGSNRGRQHDLPGRHRRAGRFGPRRRRADERPRGRAT